MSYQKTFPLILALGTAVTLSAFDARYSPSELGVSWPPPEDPTDKAASIFDHPVLGDANMLTGVVQIGADLERPFLARLDDSGNVVWSKRMPFAVSDFFDNFSLIDDSHLIVSFKEGDPNDPLAQTTDRLASFNPENGFSPRYTHSMPGMEVDPLNPFAGGRSFQAQRGGKVAIIQTEGSDIKAMLLDETGSPVFARVYSLPSGGGSPFPIPGFGLSYSFASLTEMENGDFYLTSSGADLLSQATKVVAIRLNSSGEIIWQRVIDVPGTSAFVFPRLNEQILITGNNYSQSGSVESPIVLLDENGQLVFAKSVDSVLLNGFSFSHFEESENILLQGTIAIPVGSNPEDIASDGAILILSSEGDKVGEIAYDLSDFDGLYHIGTIGENLYFELFGLDPEDGTLTHGILARSDANLENWITRSYLDVVGASANFSSFFAGDGSPYLTYRDAGQDWISVSKLDDELQEIGDCEVLADVEIVPFDPNLTVGSFSPTIANSGVTVSNWTDTPGFTSDPFALDDTPLNVEFVCGNTGGGDAVSMWDEVEAANAEGDKKAGIGWVNDVAYPYVWHYAIGGWIYILDEFSDLENIYGWDYVNEFWFWANNAWGGWYVNLEDPDWGISGWDKWE